MATLVRIRSIWEGVAGTPAYMNLYFNGDGSAAQADSDAVATFLEAVDSFQNGSLTWRTDSTAALIDSLTGDIIELRDVTPANGIGEVVTEVLPRASQALVQWRTGTFQNGREIRGRTNLPYFTEAANTSGGVVGSSIITTLTTAANVLVAGVGTDQLVVWSRITGAVPNVQNATVNSQWAVLRSRRD